MSVLVQEVSVKWGTGVWTLMNALNNKVCVPDLEIAKIHMVVLNAYAQEDTNLTNREHSALTEMNVRRTLENVKPRNVEIPLDPISMIIITSNVILDFYLFNLFYQLLKSISYNQFGRVSIK